jgi:hypothetical protein
VKIKFIYNRFVTIGFGLIGILLGYSITNIFVFIISYYILALSILIPIKPKKIIEKNLTEDFWEKENHLKDDQPDYSRKYIDVSPHSRHQTQYTTHPNPKFER